MNVRRRYSATMKRACASKTRRKEAARTHVERVNGGASNRRSCARVREEEFGREVTVLRTNVAQSGTNDGVRKM